MGANFGSAAGNSDIKYLRITSNYDGKTIDFSTGIGELKLYESLFDNTVRASASFVDTGYSEATSFGAVTESARKGFFNKSAGEKTELVVEDGYKQRLEYTGDYQLRTKKSVREAFSGSTRTSTLFTDFYSKESLENHLMEKRVTLKYEGKPSDIVNDILTNVLQTPKEVQIDAAINDFTFLGQSKKVFHVCTWLGKHAAPSEDLAGFIFYENAFNGSTGGYRFKSIDNLFGQSPIRKLIYNETTKLPPGYDYKIIKHYENTSIDIEEHLHTGSLFSSRLYTFEPFIKKFEESEFSYKTQEQESNNAGVEFYKLATDLDLQSKQTRYSTRLWDTGVMPFGRNWDSQEPNSKKPVFDINNVIRQSSNRFNQLFTTQLNILVPLDLGLHVGNVIQCDFPEITSSETKRLSDLRSGNYLIADICHKIHRTGSFSSIHLVRDTIYKK